MGSRMSSKTLVLDTNVYLTDANALFAFGRNDIAVPTIVLDEISQNLHLASRNLKNIHITTTNQINPVDLISHEKILLTDKSLEKIIRAYS